MANQLNEALQRMVAAKKQRDQTFAEKIGVDLSQGAPLEGLRTTGNIEEDDKVESTAVLTALDKRNQAMADQMDAGYALTIVFPCTEQADVFLDHVKWEQFLVENEQGTYFDGVALAQSLRIVLPDRKIHFYESKKDVKLIDEVGLIGGKL